MVRGGRDPGSEAEAGYRQILNLAVPAFLSLVAEPLFLVADSAVIGHLGTAELAGLGVASAALTTFTGLFCFPCLRDDGNIVTSNGGGGSSGSCPGWCGWLVAVCHHWSARGDHAGGYSSDGGWLVWG
ncbi:DNA-damage-inducible protein F [Cutibacterium acnes JCM 18909]|nr:DNA-damage-inducible protein F [Cutibacterium acnes JCM 18909]